MRILTLSHAHAFQPGDEHGHVGPMAFWAADETQEQCPVETERESHTHEVLSSFEFHPNVNCSQNPLSCLAPSRLPALGAGRENWLGIGIDPLRRPPRAA
ncbi:MAG: hypothetical protein MUF31_07250 [Akkermansiaceae bacterium]|nr:hypothetical protein [Akkermansiaceae bacterium]